MQEVLTGPQAKRYGAKPIVPLPGNDELVSSFARSLCGLLKNEGIYRRGNKVVRLDAEQGCLEIVFAYFFLTWVERYCYCYVTRVVRDDFSMQILRTMSKKQLRRSWHARSFAKASGRLTH